jgi:hypothetical protein
MIQTLLHTLSLMLQMHFGCVELSQRGLLVKARFSADTVQVVSQSPVKECQRGAIQAPRPLAVILSPRPCHQTHCVSVLCDWNGFFYPVRPTLVSSLFELAGQPPFYRLMCTQRRTESGVRHTCVGGVPWSCRNVLACQKYGTDGVEEGV